MHCAITRATTREQIKHLCKHALLLATENQQYLWKVVQDYGQPIMPVLLRELHLQENRMTFMTLLTVIADALL